MYFSPLPPLEKNLGSSLKDRVDSTMDSVGRDSGEQRDITPTARSHPALSLSFTPYLTDFLGCFSLCFLSLSLTFFLCVFLFLYVSHSPLLVVSHHLLIAPSLSSFRPPSLSLSESLPLFLFLSLLSHPPSVSLPPTLPPTHAKESKGGRFLH